MTYAKDAQKGLQYIGGPDQGDESWPPLYTDDERLITRKGPSISDAILHKLDRISRDIEELRETFKFITRKI